MNQTPEIPIEQLIGILDHVAGGEASAIQGVFRQVVNQLLQLQRERDAAQAEVELLRAQVKSMTEVLSGGYQQGMGGLVVDRNKARAALQGGKS